MDSITPKNGREDFITAQNPHTYWELNHTNYGTNFGRDTSGYDDNTNVTSGDLGGAESYSGMKQQNDPPQNGWMDDAIITDAAMLLYIPADLAHGTVRGLFHNGGGTNGQGGFLRATTTGVELACAVNDGGDNVDAVIYEISDADLPGWFTVGFQMCSENGDYSDMGLWVNGECLASGTRSRNLDWGSGNPDFGNNSAREPNAATVIYPDSYDGGDWGGNVSINGTGILIANFTCDNPGYISSRPGDTSPGAGNSFYTDYHTYHIESEEDYVTSLELDTLLSGYDEKTLLIDLLLETSTIEKEQFMDAYLTKVIDKKILIDTLLSTNISKRMLLDSILCDGKCLRILQDLLLEKLSSKSSNIDIINSKIVDDNIEFDILTSKKHSISLPTDIIASKEILELTQYDTLLKTESISNLLYDIFISAYETKNIKLDAITLSKPISTMRFDIEVQGETTNTISLGVDTILQSLESTYSNTYLFDTILNYSRLKNYLIDALLEKTTERNMLLDVITGTPANTISGLLDAIVFRFAWINSCKINHSNLYNMSVSFMLSGSTLFTDVPITFSSAISAS